MKIFRLLTAMVALSVASVSAATPAGQRVSAKPPKVSVQAPKSVPKAPTISGAPKVSGSPKATGSARASTPKSGKPSAVTAKKGSGSKPSTTTASTSTTTTTTTTTGTGTGTSTETGTGTGTGDTTPEPAPPNAISTKISGNPQQKARVEAMLPQGMTLEQATAGFRNQGQFIAALNAAKNQGLNFADLQTAMTVDGLSLGQAIQKVKAMPAPAPETGTGTGSSTGTTSTGTTSTGTRPPGGSL